MEEVTRRIPPDRFAHLVRVATDIFIERGYRQTQMADVAEALGVAKGTIYGYVESKEALFDAALRFADGHLAHPEPQDLPLPTPAPGATVAYVRARIAGEVTDMALIRVMNRSLVVRDARSELSTILSDLYRRIARNRLAMKLVDRCAADYPELASAWFGEGRWAQHQLLVDLLEARGNEKRFRRIDNPDVVARTILETLAFWAMHRHFDPSPREVDDAAAERAVVDLIAHGVLGSAPVPRKTTVSSKQSGS
jgi:AcrR family transcriptional regulator